MGRADRVACKIKWANVSFRSFVVKSKLLSIGLKTNQKEGLKSREIRLVFLACSLTHTRWLTPRWFLIKFNSLYIAVSRLFARDQPTKSD